MAGPTFPYGNTPFVDSRGQINRVWYDFLLQLYNKTGQQTAALPVETDVSELTEYSYTLKPISINPNAPINFSNAYKNIVIVNNVGDLPPPTGSPLTISLKADTLYYITRNELSLPYPISCTGNVQIKHISGYGATGIIYTGSDPFLSIINGSLDMSNISIQCNSFLTGTNNASPISQQRLFLRDVTVDCETLGTLTNYDINMYRSRFDCKAGWTISHSVPHVSKFYMVDCEYILGDSAVAITFGSSVYNGYKINGNYFTLSDEEQGSPLSAPTSASALSGVVSSGNVSVDGLGIVSENRFGSGADITAGVNISGADARWTFTDNIND